MSIVGEAMLIYIALALWRINSALRDGGWDGVGGIGRQLERIAKALEEISKKR
ncbi:MAG: hypothetical protein WC797_01255 [Candidatus Paceibacterota bacterium]|jgi:hypothetical protein